MLRVPNRFFFFQQISRRELNKQRKHSESLTNTAMYHVVPTEIDLDDIQSNQVVETLFPPRTLHASAYSMKIKIYSSSARKRYIKKPALSLQCARVIKSSDDKPCNGKIIVVDKVSG